MFPPAAAPLAGWPARLLAVLLTLLALGFAAPASALPSYARQTGADCAACHVGAFGPQLTPYGMEFKLGGYTDSDGQEGKVPLSAMAIANWTHTAKDQPNAPAHFSVNNNSALQEASVFLAGRLSEHVGSFVQSTYSGVDRKSFLDQMDIRYARGLKLGDQEGTIGLSLNNNPTLTDPFNTLAQWRFPYTSADLGFGLGNTPLVENLGGAVLGVNAYTLWNKHFYTEVGVYNTLSHAGLRMVNVDDPGKFSGVGTYWRTAYFQNNKRDNFSVGLFGFKANLQPDRGVLGTADRYQDLGVDASYQFLGNREHVVALNGSYVRENQTLNYTFGQLQEADNLKNSLDQFRLALSYHYRQTWGVTGGLFSTRSSQDATLNPNSYNGRADTAGYLLQGDWTPWGKESSWNAPWANVRLGVQYTGYRRYQGGSHYIDDNGNDRKASDNNTLSFFVWTAL